MSACSHKRKSGCAKMGTIPHMATVAELSSSDVLDTAYDWLCRRRRAYLTDANVRSFRQRWAEEKDPLKVGLAAGRYRFGLLTRIWNFYQNGGRDDSGGGHPELVDVGGAGILQRGGYPLAASERLLLSPPAAVALVRHRQGPRLIDRRGPGFGFARESHVKVCLLPLPRDGLVPTRGERR